MLKTILFHIPLQHRQQARIGFKRDDATAAPQQPARNQSEIPPIPAHIDQSVADLQATLHEARFHRLVNADEVGVARNGVPQIAGKFRTTERIGQACPKGGISPVRHPKGKAIFPRRQKTAHGLTERGSEWRRGLRCVKHAFCVR